MEDIEAAQLPVSALSDAFPRHACILQASWYAVPHDLSNCCLAGFCTGPPQWRSCLPHLHARQFCEHTNHQLPIVSLCRSRQGNEEAAR